MRAHTPPPTITIKNGKGDRTIESIDILKVEGDFRKDKNLDEREILGKS